MAFSYRYKTQGGVCSSVIDVELEGNVIQKVAFTGGCNGNLKAISRVAAGRTVEEIEALFTGITCGWKNTSCSDQLTKAVRAAYEAEKKQG